MRLGLLDRNIFLDWGASRCVSDWKLMREVTRLVRASTNLTVWRDFEFIARLSAVHLRDMESHPMRQPSWPKGMEDLAVPEKPGNA